VGVYRCKLFDGFDRGEGTLNNVWIELSTGDLLAWPGRSEVPNLATRSDLTNFIHIEGWAVRLKFEWIRSDVFQPYGSIDIQTSSGNWAWWRTVSPWLDQLLLTKKIDKDHELFARLKNDTWDGPILDSSLTTRTMWWCYCTNGSGILQSESV
jgi:hypothetical protein